MSEPAPIHPANPLRPTSLPLRPAGVYNPHRTPGASPLALARMLAAHHDLIWQMAKREVVGRYKGSLLGLLWSFFYPLLMLGVYTFAFAYVFKVGPKGAGWAGGEGNPIVGFALYAFSGLILFSLFTEVVTRSPSFILQNANYVKKVVFPLEVFPFVYLFSALIHAAISFLVLILALLAMNHSVPLTVSLAPLTILPLALVILGFSWFLASLGVYLRDVAQTVGILAMMLMYLSPVFYDLKIIDNPAVQIAIRLNPLTIPLISFRNTVLNGQPPEWFWLAIYFGAALLVAWLGFFFFQRTKRGFADVL